MTPQPSRQFTGRSSKKHPQELVRDARLGSPPAPDSRPLTGLTARPPTPSPRGPTRPPADERDGTRARAPRPSKARLGRGGWPSALPARCGHWGAEGILMVHRAGPRGDPSLWAAPPPMGLIPSSVPTARGAMVRLGGPRWGCVQARLRPRPHDGRTCFLRSAQGWLLALPCAEPARLLSLIPDSSEETPTGLNADAHVRCWRESRHHLARSWAAGQSAPWLSATSTHGRRVGGPRAHRHQARRDAHGSSSCPRVLRGLPGPLGWAGLRADRGAGLVPGAVVWASRWP